MNQGETFEQKVKFEKEDLTLGIVDVLTLEMDPNDSSTIYVGTLDSGLFRSTDGGEVWEQISKAKQIYSVAIDRRNSNTIYIGGTEDGQGKILKSEDFGETWKAIHNEPPVENAFIPAIEADYYNPNTVYAASARGLVLRSDDRGATWQQLAQLEGPVLRIELDPQNTRNVYLQVHDEGLFKLDYGDVAELEELDLDNKNVTTDEFAREIRVINLEELMPGDANGDEIYSLAVDPIRKDVVYIGTTSGIYRTEDGGQTWEGIATIDGPSGIPIRATTVTGPNANIIYYAVAGVFYRSFDYGRTWEALDVNVPHSISAMLVEPGNDSNIYLGVREFD